MKTLYEISNIEKARLLGQLFRDQLPVLVQAIKEACLHFIENELEVRANWANGFITVDFWFDHVHELYRQILKYELDMSRSPNVFADQCFYSHRAMVSIHGLINLSKQPATFPMLVDGIKLFFN